MTNIRDLRLKVGLSQADLAIALRVSPQAVSKWEAGTAYPRAKDLPAIAAALHCSIDDLYEQEDPS